MKKEEIEEIVLAIVKDTLYRLENSESITSESNLKDFGADSLDILEVVLRVEKRFSLCISEYDLNQLYKNATVGSLVDYIIKSYA